MDKIELVSESNTEKKIIDAARQVFIQKGYSGARMQEIADAAGFNKALVHYYFRSKDRLFEAIFKEAFAKLLPTIAHIFKGPGTLFEKIEKFTDEYIQVIMAHPYIPVFVLSEIHRNPDSFFQNYFHPEMKAGVVHIMGEFEKAVDNGEIIKTDPMQLLINMMSLCVFPFIAKPMLQRVIEASDETYNNLLAVRGKAVSTFIINAITPKQNI